MGVIRHIRAVVQSLASCLCAVVLVVGLSSCGDRPAESAMPQFSQPTEPVVTPVLKEVATPRLISRLREELAQYQPQVAIVSPQPNELLDSTTVAVQLEVHDLPLFKDEELGMGPHLHLFVDDQPYQAVYDVSEPIILKDLAPGSHLLRVFASRPWHESFKNEGAYAETTFSVFTENNIKLPDFSQPLLTYSRPQGTYGAEPIMLDFYLNNAPLHFVAQENEEDNIADWRIRVTINGDSFILDNWQPIYLEGFKKGENWLKLEFVDEQGELVENVYNNPVRVINYDPQLKDTLAQLVTDKLSLRTARKLVTTKELPPEPEVEVEVEVIEPEVIDEIIPEDVVETDEIEATDVEVIDEVDEIAAPEEVTEELESVEVEEITEPETVESEAEPELVEDEAIAPVVDITTDEPTVNVITETDEVDAVVEEFTDVEESVLETPVQEDIDVAAEEVTEVEEIVEPEELETEPETFEEVESVEVAPEPVVETDEVEEMDEIVVEPDEIEEVDEAIAPEVDATESVEDKPIWSKLPNILKAFQSERTTDSYAEGVEVEP